MGFLLGVLILFGYGCMHTMMQREPMTLEEFCDQAENEDAEVCEYLGE